MCVCIYSSIHTHTVVYMSRSERRRVEDGLEIERLQELEQQQQSVSLHARAEIMDDFFLLLFLCFNTAPAWPGV